MLPRSSIQLCESRVPLEYHSSSVTANPCFSVQSPSPYRQPSLSPRRPLMLSRLRYSAMAGSSLSYSAPASPSRSTCRYLESNFGTVEAGHEIFRKGTFVFVRCNQSKWLLGQVRRWAHGGILVWVASVQVMVNVPPSLIRTHLALFANPTFLQQIDGDHGSSKMYISAETDTKCSCLPSLPTSCPSSPCADLICTPPSLKTFKFGSNHGHIYPCLDPGYACGNPRSSFLCAFFIVRPTHLSHRQLYKPYNESHSHQAGQMDSSAIVCTNDKKSHGVSSDNGHPLFLDKVELRPNNDQIISPCKSLTPSLLANNQINCLQSSSSNIPSHMQYPRQRVQKPMTGLLHSLSLPPISRPRAPPRIQIARGDGDIQTKCALHLKKKEEACHESTHGAEALLGSDIENAVLQHPREEAVRHQCSNEALFHEAATLSQGSSLQTFAFDNSSLSERRCKSLGSHLSTDQQQQVWYTVIENGLDTRKKKNVLRTLTN